MQRFYIEDLNTNNYNFILKQKDIINQIRKVLRGKIGDKIILFDGKELFDYIFEIKKIKTKEIFLEQIDRKEKKSELDFELNLFQAIPNKLDKIESIIKNGTQIGITNFLFFKSERSQKLKISEAKIKRLNKIILESTEQSGRNIVPNLIIGDQIKFENLEGKKIFLHTSPPAPLLPGEGSSLILKDLDIEKGKTINLFVGPEGGFSEIEVESFEKNEFERIFLGDRILRTELAGINSAFYIIQSGI